MSWASLATNQGVSFADASDAVATSVLQKKFHKEGLPSNNRIMDKEEALYWLYVDPDTTTLAAKTNVLQCVEKQDLVAIINATTVTITLSTTGNNGTRFKVVATASTSVSTAVTVDYSWQVDGAETDVGTVIIASGTSSATSAFITPITTTPYTNIVLTKENLSPIQYPSTSPTQLYV